MNELEKIAKNHSLWIKMVLNMGCNPSMAEDIVQQMYVRIDRLLKEGKNVMYNKESANRFYIYLTLKSMYIDYKRARSKYTFFVIKIFYIFSKLLIDNFSMSFYSIVYTGPTYV